MAYVEPKTAKDVLATGGGGDTSLDDAARAAAEAANVSHPAYINYAAALTNYENRDDVESLAHRRAREAADAFADQDFARAEDYDGQ